MYSPVSTNEKFDLEESDALGKPEKNNLERHGKSEEGTSEDEEQIPYPKQVFFIVVNEFCERFCFYGMRTILSLYLVNILLFSESDAKVIYHTYNMFTYFFPIFGAIISDSWWGKFNTILYVSMIYALGNTVLSVSAIGNINIPQTGLSMLGLVLIAIGTGGIKPCVAAFGGDQFILPQQELKLAAFFSFFYFSINLGSLFSTFITPLLREEVHCFDADSCYPLAFAVPGILMFIAIIVFILGKPLYRITKPKGNVIVKVMQCMTYAVKKKFKSTNKQEHWLDHSRDKFGDRLVDDIKLTLRVLVLYIPLPIFWALYDQQGSGWTFQAVRMNGDIGFYNILPDQVQLINPLLILAFIPMFTYGVYPLLAKCNLLQTPLKRMVWGGLLAAAAFAISACVSLVLESTYPTLPTEGNGQIRIYNPSNCPVTLTKPNLEELVTLKPLEYYEYEVSVKNQMTAMNFKSECGFQGDLTAHEEEAYGYYFDEKSVISYEDDIDKSGSGFPKLRFLVLDPPLEGELELLDSDKEVEKSIEWTNYTQFEITPGTYHIKGFNDELKVGIGGVYTIMMQYNEKKLAIHTVTEENSVHILWLIPQYVVITAGEIMFSITGLEFSYSQAPASMKSLLQACWLLTTAFGNLIIVIIESAKIFEKQSADFFLYTGLMVADMVVFAWLAYRYKYVETKNEDEDTELSDKDKGTDNPAFKKTND